MPTMEGFVSFNRPALSQTCIDAKNLAAFINIDAKNLASFLDLMQECW
jgi:hypothetical protein